MVAQRRFLPLVAMLAIGLVVLVVRLVQVQVVEAAVWGREAANLVRSANVMPYHRGELTDRNGTLVARDEDLYQVQFEYREFRRGHPLAQVTHARSALELRAVPLTEALASLEKWAIELVSITPAELSAFARGEAVTLGGVAVPASSDAEVEQRARRASDVRYYVQALLRVTDRQARALKLEEGDPDRALSFAELVARRVRSDTVEREHADLLATLASARARLEVVAGMLADDLARAGEPGSPIEELVAVFERQRVAVEDASADDLFARATGFEPGRISPASLEATFDLRWIAGLLRWDAARLLAWERSRRSLYEERLDRVFLARMLARAAVEEQQGRKKAGARLLDALAELYAARDAGPRRRGDPAPSWTELEELAVLSELDTLFEGRRLPSEARDAGALLPLTDPELQKAEEAPEDPWLFLGMVTELARAHELDPEAPASSGEAAARWRALAEHGLDSEDDAAIAELRRLVKALEARFLEATDRALLAMRVAASGDGASKPLMLSKARLDAALQQEKSIQKDQQSRTVLLRASPPYELVHLLARFPDETAGLSVREATRRVYSVLDDAGHPLARALIGSVRKPSLKELFAQIRDERRYDALKYQVMRSASEEGELEDLNARLYRADEWTGGSGIEDYFDPELRGRFGWREVQGLAGREERSVGQAPEDGKDVELTLDLDLQRAAQDVIEHPTMPLEKTDEDWFRNPVGAIVLLGVDGEVLAAASAPSVGGEAIPGRDRERENARERTLTRPTFNPPGSVFKPFVAAFALDRLGFDARRRFACEPNGPGFGVYGDMHCAGIHHEVDLAEALMVSCNCYFAHVGEAYERQQLVDMAHVFGFDEPTGIKCFGTSGRSGLVEHWRIPWSEKMLAELDEPSGKRRFANGLRFPEASPMQVARAMAGLATGWLPEVNVARKVDGVPVPKRGRELGISDASRAFVRDAMLRVVDDPRGSAHARGLDEKTLGFRVAAKTGSADYAAIRKGTLASELEQALASEGRVRKHTWVAGWFPAENPRVVFVVYLHDLLYTSTHTATWVAGQLLGQEAVKRWLAKTLEAERGADPVEAAASHGQAGGGR